MKPLLVLARITFVGCLWSIIFIEGIRVIMLENWRFDIFWPAHWAYAWSLWQAGWVIDTPKEWAFVLILVTFIPLWLTGWIALSLVPWEVIAYKILIFPFKFIKGSVEPLAQAVSSTPVVTKKKSYKEVRPTGKRVPIYDYSTTQNNTTLPQPVVGTPALPSSPSVQTVSPAYVNPVKEKAVTARETLNHTIFDLDDEDDDFDLDIDSFDKADIFKIDSNKKKKEQKFEDDFDDEPKHAPAKQVRRGRKYEFEDEDDEPRQARQVRRGRRYEFEDDEVEDAEEENYDDFENYEPAPSRNRRQDKSALRGGREEFSSSKSGRYERTDNRSKNSRLDKRSEANVRSSGGAIGDILEDKGYDVFRNVQLNKIFVDYVAVSSDKLWIGIVDKEQGDWLADEERFNDEEPLWFSESSHRVSPVRQADLARQKFEGLLDKLGLNLEVKPIVIVVAANIINAEDMFDIWADIDVSVARFAKGTPQELPPLSKVIEDAEGRLGREDLNELRKVFK